MTKPDEVLQELAKKIEPTSFDAGMAYIRKDVEFLNNHLGRGLPPKLPGLLQEMLPYLKQEMVKEIAMVFIEVIKGFVQETQSQLREDEEYASMKLRLYRYGVRGNGEG